MLTSETATLAAADCTYQQNMGSLLINIAPAAAVEAGARWRRVGTVGWRSSGIAESNVLIGTHAVEFSAAGLWIKPANRNAAVTAGGTATLDVTYERNLSVERDSWMLLR